jgi:hypothetical protein
MYACRNGHLEAVTEFIPYLSENNIKQALPGVSFVFGVIGSTPAASKTLTTSAWFFLAAS